MSNPDVVLKSVVGEVLEWQVEGSPQGILSLQSKDVRLLPMFTS